MGLTLGKASALVGPPSVPADLAKIRHGGLAFSFHRKNRVYPGMQRDRSGTAFARRAGGAVERGAECPTGNLERSESGGAMTIALTDAVAMDRGGGRGFEQGSSSAASYAAVTAPEYVGGQRMHIVCSIYCSVLWPEIGLDSISNFVSTSTAQRKQA